MSQLGLIQEKANKFDQIMGQIKSLEDLKMKESTSFEDSEILQKEIDHLYGKLPVLSEYQQVKKLDVFLDKFDLSVDFDDNKIDIKYLLDGILVKHEITMFASSPGTGKSLSAIAITNMALDKGTISKVVYFDDDNGLSTIIDRGIQNLKVKHGSKFMYFHNSKVSKSQMWQIVKALEQSDLNEYFIVFDSIKNFIGDGDRDKNKDVSKTMTILKKLRSRGATVLYLHHTNKPQKDLDPAYAGSSAFLEDSGNAFILKKNEHRKSVIFSPIKNRTGKIDEKAYILDMQNHRMEMIDLFVAKETYLEEIIRTEIQEYLCSCDEKPIYSQIMKYIGQLGYAKDTINDVIQKGKGRFWKSTKFREQNNKDVFELIIISKASDKIDNSESPNIMDSVAKDTTVYLSDTSYKHPVSKRKEGKS